MKLYESGEDYLEAILILQKKLGEVRSVDVARYVGVSKPRACLKNKNCTKRMFYFPFS